MGNNGQENKVIMEYVCTLARFEFFDGKNVLTVHYQYAICTWYVFKDREDTDCLWHKKIDPKKSKTPTRDEAALILDEYLETQKQ